MNRSTSCSWFPYYWNQKAELVEEGDEYLGEGKSQMASERAVSGVG